MYLLVIFMRFFGKISNLQQHSHQKLAENKKYH